MDDESRDKVFEQITRTVFEEPAAQKGVRVALPGSVRAVNFFSVCATWLFCIALLLPPVWVIWTAGKWMFGF